MRPAVDLPGASATLNALLDADLGWSMEARGTSNHAPMALIALERLGAGPERLAAWAAAWYARFGVREPHPATPVDDWTALRGHPASFAALRSGFALRIAAEGVQPVLADVFDRLPAAPASSAFHAVIRLALGLQAGHAGEVAAGLAIYVAAHAPILLRPRGKAQASVDDALRALSRRLAGPPWPGDTIASRVAGVAADSRFAAALAPLPEAADPWQAMFESARDVYVASGSFIALHMMTGTQAARTVGALLADAAARRLLDAHWIAFTAAYVALGASPWTAACDEAPATWASLRVRAIASDDEHVVKLVDVCLAEDTLRPHRANRRAASRACGTTA